MVLGITPNTKFVYSLRGDILQQEITSFFINFPVFSYFFTITIKSVSEHLKYIRIIIITDSIRRKI